MQPGIWLPYDNSIKNLKDEEKTKSSNLVKQKAAMQAVPKSSLCFGLAPLLHGISANFLSKTDDFFSAVFCNNPKFLSILHIIHYYFFVSGVH